MLAVAAYLPVAGGPRGAVLSDSFSDPHNERLILIAVGGLILLGILMAAATVIWWRNNRIEHAALAPLEVMGERSWWKGNFAERRRRLDDARGRARDEHGAEFGEAVDLSAAHRSFRPGFADLIEEQPPEVDDAQVSADEPFVEDGQDDEPMDGASVEAESPPADAADVRAPQDEAVEADESADDGSKVTP